MHDSEKEIRNRAIYIEDSIVDMEPGQFATDLLPRETVQPE